MLLKYTSVSYISFESSDNDLIQATDMKKKWKKETTMSCNALCTSFNADNLNKA